MNERGISLTVLIENTVNRRGLKAEHGFSVWIETEHGNLLWDTGQDDLLLSNAQQLGKSIKSTSSIVLSHGHFDHTGGLYEVLKLAPHAQLFGHQNILLQRYSCNKKKQNSVKSIGIPFAKKDIEEIKKRLTLTPAPVDILPGIFATGEIPRETEFEDTGGSFFLDEACTEIDLITDDQALCIECSQGLIVILGCAHSGVVNTLNYVAKLTQGKRIFAVIGGMHLLHASKNRLEATAEAFTRYDIQEIGPCHCTGIKAVKYLRSKFPDRCVECSTGSQFNY